MQLCGSQDHIIEPGIDLEDYWMGKDKKGVLFAGKFETRKGVHHIVEAAKTLPDIPFTLVGWGGRDIFLDLDVPENVDIQEFKGRSHLAKEMSKAEIFVFPTQVETFGIAVAEAMASGCAIVSSSELPFSGIKIDLKNPKEIAYSVADLYSNPDRMFRLGSENVEKSKRYNWKSHGESLLNVYQQLIQKSGGNQQ